MPLVCRRSCNIAQQTFEQGKKQILWERIHSRIGRYTRRMYRLK
ncbi:hypothetical protein M2401_004314 [Pseudomonas sp. JUb42]|jgi:hypothetical protein|nr:hypothetical protein [Pseudomonas sp. JUb42]